MDRLFAAADLVVCRGGGTTVSELMAVGRAAVVVPYPHHEDQHQVRNARQLSGGVRIVEEQDLDHARCEELIRFLGAAGAEERERMRMHLREAVRPNAAHRVWTELEEVVAAR